MDYLSVEQIHEIAQRVINAVPDPYGVKSRANQELYDYIISCFENTNIESKHFDSIAEQLSTEYTKSIVCAGEMVGIQSGMALGEKQTQMQLNSFHHSGISNMTIVAGVPRFSELLDVSKNPKFVRSFLFTRAQTIKELRGFIKKPLVYTVFKKYISRVSQSAPEETEELLSIYNNIFGTNISNEYFLVLYLNPKEMMRHDATIQKLNNILSEHYECWYDSAANCIYARAEDTDETLTAIENIYVDGIPGIKNMSFRTYEDAGEKYWLIETIGSNLLNTLRLSYVDYYKTYSNHLWEIYEIFGIEAVYKFLTEEFIQIVSNDGSYTNPSHIYVMVSMMTFTGIPLPMSRYGMSPATHRICTMATFENSFDKFVGAAMNGLSDDSGLSMSIMCGAPADIGTGSVSLRY